MKILDFHKQTLMNSPTFVLTLSKLIQSQVISSDEAVGWRLSSFEDFVFVFWFVIVKQYFEHCEHVIYLPFILNVNACCTILWMCCDTCMTSPALKRFRLSLGLGVWQIGIRAIDYSELVNILNKRKIQKFTTIVSKAGTNSEQRNKYKDK